jgi:hypothetical protein
VVKRIGELYEIAAEITGQPAEARLVTRRDRALPILTPQWRCTWRKSPER